MLLELGEQLGRLDPPRDQGLHRTAQADRQRVLVRIQEGRPDEAFHGLPEELHGRSEEHTSELQSLAYLVCRLLLEKKKKKKYEYKCSKKNENKKSRYCQVWYR